VLSPDGRKIVYPAAGVEGVPRLWLRNIDSLDAHVLQAGEGLAGTRPFWSPDSRFVAFEAGGKLKKIDVTGGAPQTLCDLSGNVLGGSWNSEGVIIFGSNVGGVMRVSAGGGVAGLVTGRVDTRFNHGFPSFLPDGRHFVYHGGPASRSIYIGSLDAKPEEQSSEELVASPAGPVYAPASNLAAGYLLFLRDDTLVAQPFDTRRRKLTGEPVTIAEHVGTFLTDAFFSASENGALLYGGGGGRQARLTWFDRQGKSLSSATAPFDVFSLALSPDAGRVAVATSGVQNIWLFDFAVGASTRFTFGQDAWPVWSPDGSRIAFVAGRADRPGLYQKASSSAGNQELLLPTPPGSSRLTDWSRDGRFLLYTSFDPALKADMWVLADPLGKAADRKASPFLRTEFNEGQGRFSPDGRWIGYTSDESGKNEIFVRPFNSSSARSPQEGKWMVSRGGGTEPRWRRDGKELFYLSPDGNVMALEVSTNAVFQPGVPKVLFRAPPGATIWDAAPDGQRFLFPVLVNDSARAPFTLVLNWQAALKK
jgi:Tol biopolymer transport system component